MPAATTHVLMAKDVLRCAPNIAKQVTNKQMFYLGSQGPDLLFFNRASIFPGSTKKYGNMLHVYKVAEVISYFERFTTNPDLNSYFLGYLCHYCLDSSAHPLVYGVAHALHQQTGIPEGEIHVGLESEIDVWMLGQRGRNYKTYDVYKYLKVNKQSRNALAEMYHNMFMDVFHIDLSQKHLQQAIDDVAFYTRVLSPTKWKKTIFEAFENTALHGSHAITSMMLNDTKIGEIINLDHKTYTMPWDENETVHASFPELYGKAVIQATKLLIHHKPEDFTLNFCGTKKIVED